MKSLKRIVAAVFSISLCLSLCAAPAAFADSGKHVFDERGVLSQSQVDSLEAQAQELENLYHVGVYLAYTSNMGTRGPSSSERNEYARDYYLQHDLGTGSNKDGIIFVVAVDSRDYVSVKHFNDSSADPFSGSGVDALESKVTDCLHDNDWYGAGKAYYSVVGEQLDYFATTGEQWKKFDLMTLVLKILAALGIPGVIAFGVVNSRKNAMKTARMQTEASNYLDQGSLNLTVASDEFVNTTVTVAPLPRNENSGGRGWSNMGGGFSGSGGGKF